MTWFSRISLRRENRKEVKELYKLPDRQLEDIGLTRGDIDKLMKDED